MSGEGSHERGGPPGCRYAEPGREPSVGIRCHCGAEPANVQGWSRARRAVVEAAVAAGLEKVVARDPSATAEELATWVVSAHALGVTMNDRALVEACEAYATTLRIALVFGTVDPLPPLREYLDDLGAIGEGEDVATAALRCLRMRAAVVRELAARLPSCATCPGLATHQGHAESEEEADAAHPYTHQPIARSWVLYCEKCAAGAHDVEVIAWPMKGIR